MTTTIGPIWGHVGPGDIEDLTTTQSETMRAVIGSVRTVAPTRTTVLLTGETGIGKGLIARLTESVVLLLRHQILQCSCAGN